MRMLLNLITAALAFDSAERRTRLTGASKDHRPLWYRMCPTGQGRNAKQRRAQRKARHIKRIRSYKR